MRAVSCVPGVQLFAERKCGVSPLELGARVCLLQTGVLLSPMFDTGQRAMKLPLPIRTALLSSSSSGSSDWIAAPKLTKPSCLSACFRVRFAAGDSGAISDAVQTMDILVCTTSPALVSICSMCWITRSATDVEHTTTTSSRYSITRQMSHPEHHFAEFVETEAGACPRQSLLVPKCTDCRMPAAVGILVQVPYCARTQRHVSFKRLVPIGFGESKM